MTLAALENFDAQRKSAILASAALRTGGINEFVPDTDIGAFGSETSDVIAEIRKRLNLAQDDQSVAAVRKIDAFIADALSELVQPSDGGASALDRAGQLGRLPPSLFQLVLDEQFVRSFEKYGFRRKTVERLIYGADDLQHLLPEMQMPNSFSVFLKRELVRGTKNSWHWAVLQTARRGRKLLACSAWRVFGENVDLSQATDPLGVLKAFAEHYGAYVHLGSQHSKFIYQEHTHVDPNASSFDLMFGIENEPKRKFIQGVGGKTKEAGVISHGPFYCIDLDAYEQDLRSHGFYGF